MTFLLSPSVKEGSTVNNIKSKIESKQSAYTIKINETVVAASPVNPEIEPTVNNIQPADTAIYVATTTVAKNKLQVVHINELETFPSQFTAPVNYAQNIKLKKGKANNLSVATKQDGIGFKINLSSKN